MDGKQLESIDLRNYSDNDSRYNNLATTNLKNDWLFLWGNLFKPIVILPLILAIIALIFANAEDNKRYALLLNIIASISIAFAGGFIYDTYKTFIGNTLLIKKGQSAVRNLALARFKIRNISDRAINSASPGELTNLLSLLEKDIANATQEWNDIIPGVDKIEVTYVLLEEKENDLIMQKKEKDELATKLAASKADAAAAEKLKNEINIKDKRIEELTNQIRKIQINTSSPLFNTMSTPPMSAHSGYSGYEPGLIHRRCRACGKAFTISNPYNAFSRHAAELLCPECQENKK